MRDRQRGLADQLPAPRHQQPQFPALPLGKLFHLRAQWQTKRVRADTSLKHTLEKQNHFKKKILDDAARPAFPGYAA